MYGVFIFVLTTKLADYCPGRKRPISLSSGACSLAMCVSEAITMAMPKGQLSARIWRPVGLSKELTVRLSLPGVPLMASKVGPAA